MMRVPFVDLKAQYLSIKEEIDDAIASVINSTTFIGGDVVTSFESAFASYTGINYCIACANGTDAIEIALKALGIGSGDEVIVPALTWISTGGAVNNVGAEPVFVDVLEGERTINPALIENKITKRTKAIIPVHLYGLPARIEEIVAIASHHDLKVIEDAAQAHGATIGGQKVGTFGDIATFSFYPGKNLGAYGDAGGIVTNDPNLAKTCSMLKNHGQLQKHHHQLVGRSSRIDTLQAAILNAKLLHLDSWTEARIKASHYYDSSLKNVKNPVVPEGSKHVFHLYVIQTPLRERLMAILKKSGIGCAIHYPTPLPHVPSYRYQGHRLGDFPVAERLSSEILSLPMYPEIEEEALEKVAKVIKEIF